jgi:hypothetical protein
MKISKITPQAPSRTKSRSKIALDITQLRKKKKRVKAKQPDPVSTTLDQKNDENLFLLAIITVCVLFNHPSS